MMEPTSARADLVGKKLPHDDKLRLSSLFDSSELVAQLNEFKSSANCRVVSCRAKHVRYQPGRSCTVLYQVGHANSEVEIEEEVLIYAKSLPLDEFKRRQADSNCRADGDGIILKSPTAIPEFQALFNEFPFDDRLQQLRLLSVTDELKQLLVRLMSGHFSSNGLTIIDCSHAQPLRYKPENRLVARCRLALRGNGNTEDRTKDIILRFERQSRPGISFALTKHLRSLIDSNSHIGFPKPLFASEEYGISAFEVIEAVKLSDMLSDDNASDAVRLAAQAAAALHSFADTGLAIRNPLFHLLRSRRSSELIGRCIPSCRQSVSELADKLASHASTSGTEYVGLVHGDFHQGNLLHSGGKTWVLDLDRAYTGDCTADIGSFLGQMKLLELRGRLPQEAHYAQQFREEYEKAMVRKVAPDQIAFWMVINLLELASRECRRLKPNWTETVDKILNSCWDILDKRSYT